MLPRSAGLDRLKKKSEKSLMFNDENTRNVNWFTITLHLVMDVTAVESGEL